jgi:hypothetical protein
VKGDNLGCLLPVRRTAADGGPVRLASSLLRLAEQFIMRRKEFFAGSDVRRVGLAKQAALRTRINNGLLI